MIRQTRGVVVRTVPYGETSLVVHVFTEGYGIQAYMVSGVRKAGKKAAMTPGQFQPAALLEMVVYHHEKQQLQRIKECRWAFLYHHIYQDMHKNAVALFMIELLRNCLKQPESHEELFAYMEDALIALDQATPLTTANFPLYFSLHLTHFFGFRLEDTYSPARQVLDLQEGVFTSEAPDHPFWIDGALSATVSAFLKSQLPSDTETIRLNREARRQLLDHILNYYRLHIPDFANLKTLPVLQTILD